MSKTPALLKRHELVPAIAKAGVASLSFGGISRDGAFGWVGYEDEVALFDCATKERRAVWMFQKTNDAEEEEELTVLCAEEAVIGDRRFLVVATMDKAEADCQLRFLDLATSKTVGLLSMPQPVSALHFIGAPIAFGFLSGFSSILAVGTTAGHTLLLDVHFVRSNSASSPQMGLEAIRPQFYKRENWPAGVIPYVDLDAGYHKSGILEFPQSSERGKQQDTKLLPEKGVIVTSLHYIPQLWSLVVGYNFGCFQLWSLYSGQLLYSSPFEAEGGLSVVKRVPVTKFGYQELSSHQGHGHIWVGRSSLSSPLCCSPHPATMTLYGVRFTLPNFEEEEMTVKDVQLGQVTEEYKQSLSSFHNNERERLAARIVDIVPVPIREHKFDAGVEESWSRAVAKEYGGASDEDMMEEDEETGVGWLEKGKEKSTHRKNDGIPKALFVWEAFLSSAKSGGQPEYHMVLFDLNVVKGGSTAFHRKASLPEYFTSFSLSLLESPQLLGVWLDPSSITEFSPTKGGFTKELDGDQGNDAEAFSLSFDISFLSESTVTEMSFMGDQQKALSSLAERGPVDLSDDVSAIAGTMRLYVECKRAGLIPFLPVTQSGQSENDPIYQKRCLLDICYKYNMLPTVCQLVRKRSLDAERSYRLIGPKIVLDWAWSAFKNLEVFCTDPQCGLYAKVFDTKRFHASTKRRQLLDLLDVIRVRASGLHSVFLSLLSRTDNTQEGYNALQKKAHGILLFSQHLEVITWLYRKELITASYPYQNMQESYNLRKHARAERYNQNNFHVKDMNGHRVTEPIDSEETKLFVDMLFSTLEQQKDGAEEGTLYPPLQLEHSYPPPSVQSLVRIFVTGNPQALVEKKCIMYYFLLDWVHSVKLDWQAFEDFADAFNLPPQYRALITGFWLLDYARPEEAVERFHSVQTKILVQEWAGPIVTALHDLGSYFHALALGDACLTSLPSLQESVVQIRLLLHNGIITRAFSFQRVYSGSAAERETLLFHLFQFFNDAKRLRELFRFSMDAFEEKCLQQYLQNMGDNSQSVGYEYLVLFLLSRARYAEAISCFDTHLAKDSMVDEEEGLGFYLTREGKDKEKGRDAGAERGADLKMLQAIIQNYKKILPSVQQQGTGKSTTATTAPAAVAPVSVSRPAVVPTAQPPAPTPAPRASLSFSLTETPIVATPSTATNISSFAAATPLAAHASPTHGRPIRRLSFGVGGPMQQRGKPGQFHLSPTHPPAEQRLSQVHQQQIQQPPQMQAPISQMPSFSSTPTRMHTDTVGMPATNTVSPFGVPPSPSGGLTPGSSTPLKKRAPIKSLGRRPRGLLGSPGQSGRRVSFTEDMSDLMNREEPESGGDSDEDAPQRTSLRDELPHRSPAHQVNGDYSDSDMPDEEDSLVSAKQRRNGQKKREAETSEARKADDGGPAPVKRLAKRSKRAPVRKTTREKDLDEDSDGKGKEKVRTKGKEKEKEKERDSKTKLTNSARKPAATPRRDDKTPTHKMTLRSKRK